MKWLGYKVIKQPTALAVKLADVKLYLRIDTTDEDNLLKSMIRAATTIVENYLERALITQTIEQTMDNFVKRIDSHRTRYNQQGVIESTANEVYNEQNFVYLHKGIVQEISSLVTYDDANVATTFDSARYFLDTANDKSRLVLNDQDTWPTDLRDHSAITITYISGYGDSEKDVPEDIKLALQMMVSTMYEHRCEPKISSGAKTLLGPYKIYSLG